MQREDSAVEANEKVRVAVSSCCFPTGNLERILKSCVESGFAVLELSGNIKFQEDARELLLSYRDRIEYEVHNYFPPPAKHFVLNLAHPDSATMSWEHCLKAVDLCAELGIGMYSLHAGLAFSPSVAHLGQDQSSLSAMDLDESRKLLLGYVKRLGDYAAEKGVQILLENNVVADFNLVEGRNARYHLADCEEGPAFAEAFLHPNVFCMLDTGHLKVSAASLAYDRADFVALCKPHVRALQLSENDGTSDQNLALDPSSWFWKADIPWEQAGYVSLEVYNLDTDMLLEQVELTRKLVARRIQERSRGSAGT